MLFLFVPEKLPEPGHFLVAEWFCPGNAVETGTFLGRGMVLSWKCGGNRDVSLCAGGDHSLESVSQCFKEELPAELVGNMVGLNAGGDAFREEVVGEAAHVEGVGLGEVDGVVPYVQIVLQAEGKGNGLFYLGDIQQVTTEYIKAEFLEVAVEASGHFLYFAGEDELQRLGQRPVFLLNVAGIVEPRETVGVAALHNLLHVGVVFLGDLHAGKFLQQLVGVVLVGLHGTGNFNAKGAVGSLQIRPVHIHKGGILAPQHPLKGKLCIALKKAGVKFPVAHIAEFSPLS